MSLFPSINQWIVLNDLWDGPKALSTADVIAHRYYHHNVESTPATPLQPHQQDIDPPAISWNAAFMATAKWGIIASTSKKYE